MLIRFMAYRGGYLSLKENLFIFSNGTLVKPTHVIQLLSTLLMRLNLNPKLYNTHLLRIGHASDMFKYKQKLNEISAAGRWTSTAVYKYLKF